MEEKEVKVKFNMFKPEPEPENKKMASKKDLPEEKEKEAQEDVVTNEPHIYLIGIRNKASFFHALLTLLKIFNKDQDFMYLVIIYDRNMDQKQESEDKKLLKKCQRILEKMNIDGNNYEFVAEEKEENKFAIEQIYEIANARGANCIVIGGFGGNESQKKLIIQTDFDIDLKINVLANKIKVPTMIVKRPMVPNLEELPKTKFRWLFLIKSIDDNSLEPLYKFIKYVNCELDEIHGLYLKNTSIRLSSKVESKSQTMKEINVISQPLPDKEKTKEERMKDSMVYLTSTPVASLFSGVTKLPKEPKEPKEVKEEKKDIFGSMAEPNSKFATQSKDNKEKDPVELKFRTIIKENSKIDESKVDFFIVNFYNDVQNKFEVFDTWYTEVYKQKCDFFVLGNNDNTHLRHEDYCTHLNFLSNLVKCKYMTNIFIDH